MKLYEIHIFAGYITDGGSMHYNCFKKYVTASSKRKATRKAKKELQAEGYIDIEISSVLL